jgi:hypothetical protein
LSGGNAVPTCTYGRQTAYEIEQRFILAIPGIITFFGNPLTLPKERFPKRENDERNLPEGETQKKMF